jgi:regulator of sigma E protease
MSFLLAYLVCSLLGLAVGLPVGAVNRVELVQPDCAAARAGLETGDVVVEISGKRIRSGSEMVDIIHNSLNKALVIVVRRDNRVLRLRATPEPGKIDGKTVGLLGFVPTPKLERVGLVESVEYGTKATFSFIVGIVSVLASREVKESVGGPLAIIDATITSVKGGMHRFLQLIGILSIGLGVINLLPIPIVDGGQILLLAVEKIRGRRLSRRTLEVAQGIGLTVIALIFVLIMYLDLSRIAANKLFR